MQSTQSSLLSLKIRVLRMASSMNKLWGNGYSTLLHLLRTGLRTTD